MGDIIYAPSNLHNRFWFKRTKAIGHRDRNKAWNDMEFSIHISYTKNKMEIEMQNRVSEIKMVTFKEFAKQSVHLICSGLLSTF